MTYFKSSIVALLCAVIFVVSTPQAHAATTYYSSNDAYIQYLMSQVAALQAQLNALIAAQGGSTGSQNADVRVTTGGVDQIESDSVEFDGTLEFTDDNEARVWFEYGTSMSSLQYSTISDVIKEGSKSSVKFTLIADDIDTNRTYYFRAVAEDEGGDYAEGAIKSFSITGSNNWDDDDDDDNDDEDRPDVTTDEADDVDETSAELTGEIDMNDFEDGYVFFVYGEDEDQVDDATSEDEFDDIDEDGDNLQLLVVDSSFDNDDDFAQDITGLDDDTDYFFVLCVEYEDEDGDETLECGDVEEFTTDDF
jgi:hypothetical protein